MSLTSMFDHKADVYRMTENKFKVDALREKINTYAKVGREKLGLDVTGLDRKDEGAGETLTGTATGMMRARTIVREEDVLDVTKGPHAPIRLRVTRLTHPRGHHVEFEAEPFSGEFDA